MILRPYGMVIDGVLELGLEAVVVEGVIAELRPHTGIPEDWVLSPAFVNAHSHLEYRGLQGKVPGGDYWSWIREITKLKVGQSPEQVAADCVVAAGENLASGVGLIGEHSDRAGAAAALNLIGIKGIIFQELITFFEQSSPDSKFEKVVFNAFQAAREFLGGPVFVNPHATYTVDSRTLKAIGERGEPVSIHFAESRVEREFFENHNGPIADMVRANNLEMPSTRQSPLDYLEEHGLLRRDVQLVHACDVTEAEIGRIAESGATVAHCPRSNLALQCPTAPIYEMLEAGIAVGLGMDSAASSGPIDMFAEMRAALAVASERGRPLSGEQVWRMATRVGALSIPLPKFGSLGWEIAEGSPVPLIKIHVSGADSIATVIEQGSPDMIEWV